VSSTPKPLLSVRDGICLTVGMVVGVGIFKAPGKIAGASSSAAEFFFAWALGGIACLCGALVYAELASRQPGAGGEYTFLRRGWGSCVAFVFAWSRMTVVQTGAIAAVSFVFGEYASHVVSLGANGTAWWAATGVLLLTGLNLAGALQSTSLQKILVLALVASLAAIAVGGIAVGGPAKPASGATSGSFSLAVIFVLYTFGGWSEAAYLGGEVRDASRNMVKILVYGILVVTALYLLVNLGYYSALGLGGMKESKVIAFDAIRLLAGEKAAVVLALVVCVAALTTMNAAIFTGARTIWAMGVDSPGMRFLGQWRDKGSTPANALSIQSSIVLALIWAGSFTEDGFEAMVAYGLPVFWLFLLLIGLTLFVLRQRGDVADFKVPFFPLVPIAFCAMCLFMLWSSIQYLRDPVFGPKFGALVLAGIVVMAAGIPLYFVVRRQEIREPAGAA
jgi:basic amino acid/polyamine antiporter, APA family